MLERNRETLRQMRILRALEESRLGVTIEALAEEHGVSTRTIRRDIDALEEIGAPIERATRDGKAIRKMTREPFRTFAEMGLSLSELSALYMGRALLECLAASPFRQDLKCAFEKLELALTPRMCGFLDKLPGVLGTKTVAQKRATDTAQEAVARLLQASLEHRRVRMRYQSFSSGGARKTYVVEPYRLVCAEGGVYFMAHVPAYGQMRTFAVERVRSLSLTDEKFVPDKELAGDAFPDSLGVNVGEAVIVKLEFAPRIARYVQERTYHRTQKTVMQADGTLLMHLKVCNDWALRSWVLGFGPFVRVIEPAELAQEILRQLSDARDRYLPRLVLDKPEHPADWPPQPLLPFNRRARSGS